MSVHGPMPRSAWIFPALSVLLFAGATVLGYTFTPSAVGLAFAVVLLVILFGTVFAAVHHAEVIAERIARVAAPLLIMHGARDSTIPIRFGERLFSLAHEPKQFVRFRDGSHDDLDNYGAIETAPDFIHASKG